MLLSWEFILSGNIDLKSIEDVFEWCVSKEEVTITQLTSEIIESVNAEPIEISEPKIESIKTESVIKDHI